VAAPRGGVEAAVCGGDERRAGSAERRLARAPAALAGREVEGDQRAAVRDDGEVTRDGHGAVRRPGVGDRRPPAALARGGDGLHAPVDGGVDGPVRDGGAAERLRELAVRPPPLAGREVEGDQRVRSGEAVGEDDQRPVGGRVLRERDAPPDRPSVGSTPRDVPLVADGDGVRDRVAPPGVCVASRPVQPARPPTPASSARSERRDRREGRSTGVERPAGVRSGDAASRRDCVVPGRGASEPTPRGAPDGSRAGPGSAPDD
jgi:hypothetical protein